MTSPIEPRTVRLYHAPRDAPPEPTLAAAIVSAAVASYLVIPALAPRVLAMLIGQALLLAVPIGAVLIARVPRPLATLGLRPAPARAFVAAIAIGATAWYVNMRLVALLQVPDREARVLEQLVERPSLASALVMFALAPALCEELVFRGVLARALGARLPVAAAAALSALVFAAYHLSVVQALPTLTLGFALGVLAIRAGSIVPAIVAHALNNAIAIAMSRDVLPGATAALQHQPTLALVVCCATTAVGLTLAWRPGAMAHHDLRA